MGESLTQQRRVKEEGLRIVNFCCQGRRRTVPDEEAPANYVPTMAATEGSEGESNDWGEVVTR